MSSDDDPRLPPPDPLLQLITDIDQHAANASHIMKVIHNEYQALVEHGTPSLAAAIIIGTRWRIT